MSLDVFFEQVCNAWPAAFSDLAWLENSLVIALPPVNVRSIRFELQEEECLHLKDMRILRLGEDGDYSALDLGSATLNLSSCYPGAEKLLHERYFLQGSDFIGFHTQREDRPWIEVVLEEPVASGVLLLSNRRDEYASRARTLLVSCVAETGDMFTLYNAAERVKEVERWLLQQYLSAFGKVDAQYAKCADLLLNMVRWDTKATTSIFLRNKLFNRYRTQLNKIAQLYRLEFTIHGLKRSFRFWSRPEKTRYLQFGKQVANELEAVGAQVCFGFGAILGFVRTGDFIQHDDDLDLLVAFDKEQMPTLSAGLRVVEDCLRAAGYGVAGDFLSHRWVSRPGGPNLDIFVGLIEGDRASFYPSRRHAYRADDIFPSELVEFHGVEVSMPKNIMTYLEKTYGPDWRIPNSSFGHSWDEGAYEDIR